MALIVNGKPANEDALYAEFSSIKSYFEQLGNVSCCERDEEFRGYARQNIIARVLLTQEALNTTPAACADDVEKAFDKLKEEHGGEKRFYVNIGATPDQADQIRNDISINLRVEKMIDNLCADQPDPTEAQLRDFYEQHLSVFMSPEEIRASHISKSPPRAEQRDEAYKQFREVRKQLLAGADFDQLAKEHSDRGQELIDLGFFSRGQPPEEFELVAFSMNVGEVSPVFTSGVGYHIVKVTGHKPSAAKPSDEVKNDVRTLLLQQRRQEKMRELVASLQAKAHIEDVTDEQPSEVA